jgi:hypothetical protein
VGFVPRTESRSTRPLVVLAAVLTFARRSTARTGIRRHVQRLQRVTPIQQFAPGAGNRALFEREGAGTFSIRILAYRDGRTGRLLLVPVDERVVAGWLA